VKKTAKVPTEAEVHFHPEMLRQLKDALEESSKLSDAARSIKFELADKVATSHALDAVLAFLDQLGIESYPLLRLWGAVDKAIEGGSDPLTEPIRVKGRKRGKKGEHKATDQTKEIEITAALAMELICKAGGHIDEAQKEVRERMASSGYPVAKTTVKNWREKKFIGASERAEEFHELLKRHEPSGAHGLMGVGNAEAYRLAANRVLRELDLQCRLITKSFR